MKTTLFKYADKLSSKTYKQGAKKIAYSFVTTTDQEGFAWDHNHVYGKSLRKVRVAVKAAMKKLPKNQVIIGA